MDNTEYTRLIQLNLQYKEKQYEDLINYLKNKAPHILAEFYKRDLENEQQSRIPAQLSAEK